MPAKPRRGSDAPARAEPILTRDRSERRLALPDRAPHGGRARSGVRGRSGRPDRRRLRPGQGLFGPHAEARACRSPCVPKSARIDARAPPRGPLHRRVPGGGRERAGPSRRPRAADQAPRRGPAPAAWRGASHGEAGRRLDPPPGSRRLKGCLKPRGGKLPRGFQDPGQEDRGVLSGKAAFAPDAPRPKKVRGGGLSEFSDERSGRQRKPQSAASSIRAGVSIPSTPVAGSRKTTCSTPAVRSPSASRCWRAAPGRHSASTAARTASLTRR